MAWVAPALNIASSLFGGHEAKKAASAQQQGSQAGLDWVKNVYGNAQGNLGGYVQGGLGALSNLTANNYVQSPAYQYMKDEMVSGIDASAANRGNLYSGGHNLDLARHLNGLAASDYNQWWDNQLGLAGLGAQAASNLGSIGTATMGNVQNGYNGIANAQGQGYGANAAMFGNIAGSLGGLVGGQSSYGGGSQAGSFGLPAPVTPYANTSYGTSGQWFHA